MRRFEQTPHALTRDTNLSLGARALYPLLRDLAWEGGRRNPDDAVPLPTVEDIAEALGCAPSTCRTYVSELRATGWVETVRASRRRPSLWVIRDDPSAPKSGALATPESAGKRAPSAPKSDIYTPSSTDTSDEGTTSPPAVFLLEGQNLPLNALLAECGIDQASPRLGQAVAALNGRNRTARTPAVPGIRDLFWEECRRYAEQSDNLDALDVMRREPERFAELLAQAIGRKADKYRRTLHGATISPTALRDWWLDMENQQRSTAGLTSKRMENLA